VGKTSDPYITRHIYFSKQAEQAEKSKKAKQLRQRRVQRVVDWSDARAYDRLAPLDEARDDGGGYVVCQVVRPTIPFRTIRFRSNPIDSIRFRCPFTATARARRGARARRLAHAALRLPADVQGESRVAKPTIP
jgi:hypothetical protein